MANKTIGWSNRPGRNQEIYKNIENLCNLFPKKATAGTRITQESCQNIALSVDEIILDVTCDYERLIRKVVEIGQVSFSRAAPIEDMQKIAMAESDLVDSLVELIVDRFRSNCGCK